MNLFEVVKFLIKWLRFRWKKIALFGQRVLPSWPPSPEAIAGNGGVLSVALSSILFVLIRKSREENSLTSEENRYIKHELSKRSQRLLHLLSLRIESALGTLKPDAKSTPKQMLEMLTAIERGAKFAIDSMKHDSMKSVTPAETNDLKQCILFTEGFIGNIQKLQQDHQHATTKGEAEELSTESDIQELLDHSEKVASCGGIHGVAVMGYIVLAIELRQSILTKSDALARSIVTSRDPHDLGTLENDSATSAELVELVKLREQLRKHVDRFQANNKVARALEVVLAQPIREAQRVMQVRQSRQIGKLWRLAKRSKDQVPLMIASSLLSILTNSLQSLRIYLHSSLIDRASQRLGGGPGAKPLLPAVRALATVELVNITGEMIQERINVMGRAGFIRQLKLDLFSALLSKDLDFLETNDLWDCRFLIGSATHICSQVFDFPITVVGSCARIITSGVMLYRTSPPLFAAMSAVLTARMLLQQWLERAKERVAALAERSNVTSMRDVWMMLVDPVALRTLRLFGKESVEVEKYRNFLLSRDRQLEREQTAYGVFDPLGDLVSKAVSILGVWYGSHLATTSAMRPAEVATFVDASENLFTYVQFLHEFFKSTGDEILDPTEQMHDLIHQSLPAIGISTPELSKMPSDPRTLGWSIQFENVHFSYPSRPQAKVLNGVSFSVAAGEQVGILGISGGGKSSLLALLARLYNADEGVVRVADRQVAEWNPLWLRQQVAVASQSSFFPCPTVKDNLLFAIESASVLPTLDSYPRWSTSQSAMRRDDRDLVLKRVLDMACCLDLFFDTTRFPNEWYTDLGTNASKLSGGEKQRLGLAMSLLRNPRVLCLDESTSALDEESQFEVQEKLKAYHAHRSATGEPLTVVIIAHRLSNFRHVDKLVVIDQGQAVESGTPEELLRNKSGIFSLYLQRQQEVDFGSESTKCEQGDVVEEDQGSGVVGDTYASL